MSKTGNYTVIVGKIGTSMVVTTPPPANVAGGVWYDFKGYLQDINGNRLAGKTIVLNVNGSDFPATVTTSAAGEWSWRLSNEPGTYTIYAKFAGDSTYEGC